MVQTGSPILSKTLENPSISRLLRPVCFIVCSIIFLNGIRSYWFYTVEDAYISFRYAQNLLAGNGLVYNPGDYVEGYTNFLWIIIISLFHLVFPLPFIAKVIGACLGLLTIGLLVFLGWQNNSYTYEGIFAAALTACIPGFQMWSVAGLETPMFIFFLVAAIYASTTSVSYHAFLSGICFGCASITRPEGVLFFLLYLIPIATRIHRFHCLQYMIGFAVIFCPHLLFRYLYYQCWIPNTFWVKGKRFQEGGWAYMTRYAAMTGFAVFPFSIIGLFLKSSRSIFLSLWLPSVAYLIYVYQVGGDWMPMGRFLVPVIPVISLSVFYALRRSGHRLAFHIAAIVLLANITISSSSTFFDMIRWRRSHYVDILKWEQSHLDDWERIGKWLGENAVQGEWMATGLGGVIPYYAGLRNIDRSGLNDKEIAQIIWKATSLEGEIDQVGRVVLDRNPKYILDDKKSFDLLHSNPTILNPESEVISAFSDQYRVREVKIDDRYFTYFERRDLAK